MSCWLLCQFRWDKHGAYTCRYPLTQNNPISITWRLYMSQAYSNGRRHWLMFGTSVSVNDVSLLLRDNLWKICVKRHFIKHILGDVTDVPFVSPNGYLSRQWSHISLQWGNRCSHYRRDADQLSAPERKTRSHRCDYHLRNVKLLECSKVGRICGFWNSTFYLQWVAKFPVWQKRPHTEQPNQVQFMRMLKLIRKPEVKNP